MISLEKWTILTPIQKSPKNVGDLGKFFVDKGFKKLPKVQKIARSGHTVYYPFLFKYIIITAENKYGKDCSWYTHRILTIFESGIGYLS